jgi:diaminopimelate epimerase
VTNAKGSSGRGALPVVKAHAYGNDFLLVPGDPDTTPYASAFARSLCHRHHGVGADGVIFYVSAVAGGSTSATMSLFNADGSPSELSGNGLRCLAAQLARAGALPIGSMVRVETGAGPKSLELLDVAGSRYTFRAALGPPTDVRQVEIAVAGEVMTASVLGMGNPQCVVLGPPPDAATFNRLGPALSTHPMFPQGTNVSFATVETPDRVRILIWERGVGPTSSSGTGTSASAVAAIAHAGASRELDVVAPGGTQRVEWRADGVYLTGWADVVLEGSWIQRDPSDSSYES